MRSKKADRFVKKKKSKGDVFINMVVIILFGGVFVWMFSSAFNEANDGSKTESPYLSSLPPLSDTLAHSKICMGDDFYQGDYKTAPLIVRDKTYYGCSQKAVQDLSRNVDLRTAIDPLSKRKLDKASAIIALHPKRDGKVI